MHSLMPADFPHALLDHSPDAVADDRAFRVDAGFDRTGRGLQLRYRLRGPIAELRLDHAPGSLPSARLWAHSCFEAFVAADAARYREFNFAPNGQWAAFDFVDYRQPAEPTATPSAAPLLESWRDGDDFFLVAELPDVLIPASDGERALGLSAVLERIDGSLAYFALAQTSDRPDFHDRRGWRCRLAARAPA